MDPAAFAEARLAEDEARAARAKSLRDKLDDPHRQITPDVRDGAEHAWHETTADPARALREVEAGRRILERHAACPSGAGYHDMFTDRPPAMVPSTPGTRLRPTRPALSARWRPDGASWSVTLPALPARVTTTCSLVPARAPTSISGARVGSCRAGR